MSEHAIRRPRRRAASLGAALLAALGLLGCQAIPGSGPVSEGLASLDQAEQPVQFDSGGPAEGASQEDIVRGFVRAMTTSVDDYAVAREFLTPAYGPQWDPSAGVFVDEGNQPYHSAGDDIGELRLSGHATVDARGTLTPLPAGSEDAMRFEFEQVGEEWRISSAPNGIILDRTTFAAVWAPRQLYFLSGDDRLVPETRWFLNRASLISTQIVGELLAGPADTEAQALRTAFPAGTVLTSSAVPVNNGIARIDLSPELLNTEPETMELVKRQLATSLLSVSGVTGFEISVNGAVVEQAPVASPESDARDTDHLQTVVLKEDLLGTLATGEVEALPRIGKRIAALHPTAVSLDAEHANAVIRYPVSGGQAVAWVSSEDVVTLDLRRGMLAPGLDRAGYVWSFARGEPEAILVQRPGEPGELLPMPGLGGRVPVAVRVSPGGSRLAILVPDGAGGSTALLASIVRDADSKPVALTEEAVVSMRLEGEPIDLDWVDELRLVTLTGGSTGAKVTLGSLGQLPLDAGTVPGGVAVSGGGSRALIRILDDEGRMYAPQGSGWQRQSDDIELIARFG